jgi:hypothetical protein
MRFKSCRASVVVKLEALNGILSAIYVRFARKHPVGVWKTDIDRKITWHRLLVVNVHCVPRYQVYQPSKSHLRFQPNFFPMIFQELAEDNIRSIFSFCDISIVFALGTCKGESVERIQRPRPFLNLLYETNEYLRRLQ